MTIQLRPFQTPNFVLTSFESVSFPLKDVPADELATLCADFQAEVFKKAGKTDPATHGRCTCSGCGKVVGNAWRDSDGHHCLTCLAEQRDALRVAIT